VVTRDGYTAPVIFIWIDGGKCYDENKIRTDPEITGIRYTTDEHADENVDELIESLAEKDINYIEMVIIQKNGYSEDR
jgi:hypothetical protein